MSKITLVFAFAFLIAAATATPTFSLNLQKTFGQPGGLVGSSQNSGGIFGIILSKLQFFVSKLNPQVATTTTRRPRPKTTKATSVSDITTTTSTERSDVGSSSGDTDFEEVKKQLEGKMTGSTKENVTTTSETLTADIESSSKLDDISETDVEIEMKDQEIVSEKESTDLEEMTSTTENFGKEINDFFLSKDDDDQKLQDTDKDIQTDSDVTNVSLFKEKDVSLKISNSNEIDPLFEDISMTKPWWNGNNSTKEE